MRYRRTLVLATCFQAFTFACGDSGGSGEDGGAGGSASTTSTTSTGSGKTSSSSSSSGSSTSGNASTSTSQTTGAGSTSTGNAMLTPILQLLQGVAPGTAFEALPADTQQQLRQHADLYLAGVHQRWGTQGLEAKAQTVIQNPTVAIKDNLDRVLGYLLGPSLGDTFVPSADIESSVLAEQARRFYVAIMAVQRGSIASVIDGAKAWDGTDAHEWIAVDRATLDEEKAFAADIRDTLLQLDPASLSSSDRIVREQLLLLVRSVAQGTYYYGHGGNDQLRVALGGSLFGDALYTWSLLPTAFDDESFLQAVNAFAFASTDALEAVNVGTVDTFNWDIEQYLDPAAFEDAGLDPMSPAAGPYGLLGQWYAARINAHPDADARCTIYSDAQREAMWDSFTADMFFPADTPTFAAYAAGYSAVADQRLTNIRTLAVGALDAAFPDNTIITPQQRAQVVAAIQAETRPGVIIETTSAALDAATGNTVASTAYNAAFDNLTFIGGYDDPNAPVTQADLDAVNATYTAYKNWVATEYAGLPVNIANLLPPSVIVENGEISRAYEDGSIVIGLRAGMDRLTLIRTLVHEGKHAIDWKAASFVQGAAWEGGALATEELVLPRILPALLADEADAIPLYRLGSEVYYVRLTATTDATLKVLARTSCGPNEPDSIAFVGEVCDSYGVAQSSWLLRSRRAHWGTQYLQYDYGLVVEKNIASYLQSQIFNVRVVDPYLLQACNIPSPMATPAVVTALQNCLGSGTFEPASH